MTAITSGHRSCFFLGSNNTAETRALGTSQALLTLADQEANVFAIAAVFADIVKVVAFAALTQMLVSPAADS